MNASMLVPFAVVASAKKERRSRLAEAMFPTMIPLPPSQMVAIAAISADAQVRREERSVAAVKAAADAQLTAAKYALEVAVPALAGIIPQGTTLSAEDHQMLSAALADLQLSQKVTDCVSGLKPTS